MRVRQFVGIVGALTVALGFIPCHVRGMSANAASIRCIDLAAADFSKIPEAPTHIAAAKVAAPDGALMDYCEVEGYVEPTVGFRLRLPLNQWNGKLIELGCGGACGTTDDRSPLYTFKCADPLRRGYACIVSDGGHKSSGLEMQWADHNPPAVIEYLVRASHVTAIAGKAIAQRYYGQPPNLSYFLGCSAGGIQAMSEAQRFPSDFAGIVAGSPALHLAGNWTNWLWANRELTSASGEPLLRRADLEYLHQRVLAKCDLNDGLEDGLIGDPRQCDFIVADVQCTASQTDHCLTRRQVQAVERIYGGPTTSKGKPIERPIAMKGSERT